MPPSPLHSQQTSPSNNDDHRFNQIERRLDQTDARFEKYDQLILALQRSQDRFDLLLSTFTSEMKELKEKDLDITTIVSAHEKTIDQHTSRWNIFSTIAKTLVGLLISVGLLFLGTIISHLIH